MPKATPKKTEKAKSEKKPAVKAAKPKEPKVTKIKVGALANELKIEPKDLLKSLKDLGVEAKTALSSIDEETAKVIRELNAPKSKPTPAPVPKPVPASKPTPTPIPASSPAPTPPPVPTTPPPAPKPVDLVIETEDISVKELADKLLAKPSDLIKELMKKGTLVNINQRIGAETAREIAAGLGKQLIVKKREAQAQTQVTVDAKNLVHRPPIVTIMGHVDHGKTKLLDAIRKTRVAEGEAGGITQHIGAYQVEVHGKKVTFLDTPGHEAFTALRARGAKVTDIAVLVVAADDGVKPQTIEAIDHAKAAGVPIMVAINKVDKPEANLDRVKQQLSEHDLSPEEWGGKTVMVQTSAKQLTGISELLEMILLQAEILELKADPNGTAVGVVIEARLDKGKGPVADVLVKNGTLRVGDNFVIGGTYGKIKALFNDRGQRLTSAEPAMPVEVLGSNDVPTAGDQLQVVGGEKEARQIAEKQHLSQAGARRNKVLSLFDFSKNVKSGEQKQLNLVIKADVQGSMDAIVKSIQDLIIGNIHINIIHAAVGSVTESNIMLAKASDAIVACFNVNLEGSSESLAGQEGVEIRRYDIIYKLIDDVKLAMEGLLEPEFEEVVIGHAEVRNLFSFSKVGVIAGCFVKDGRMVRGAKMRIFRGTEKIYDGKMESLKRFKDDVKSVEQNFECGIAIPGFTNFKVGDEIEAYEIREKARQK